MSTRRYVRLTQRELRAIEEALNSRLAGELHAEFGGEDEAVKKFGLQSRRVYDSALAKIQDRLR